MTVALEFLIMGVGGRGKKRPYKATDERKKVGLARKALTTKNGNARR